VPSRVLWLTVIVVGAYQLAMTRTKTPLVAVVMMTTMMVMAFVAEVRMKPMSTARLNPGQWLLLLLLLLEKLHALPRW
jgi:hypothetical protein